jgi:hypothetical protein
MPRVQRIRLRHFPPASGQQADRAKAQQAEAGRFGDGNQLQAVYLAVGRASCVE